MAFIKRILHFIRLIFTLPILLYQKLLSPILSGRQGACRYHPSCSEFSRQAIMAHGILPGVVLGTARILRCHSLFSGGEDPIPQKFTIQAITQPYREFSLKKKK